MPGPPIPNLVQLVNIDGMLAALDSLGDIWLIQIHPHAQFNPLNMSKASWSPRLYYIKPEVTIGSSNA